MRGYGTHDADLDIRLGTLWPDIVLRQNIIHRGGTCGKSMPTHWYQRGAQNVACLREVQAQECTKLGYNCCEEKEVDRQGGENRDGEKGRREREARERARTKVDVKQKPG